VQPSEWFHAAVGLVQFFRRTTLNYRTHRYWDFLMWRFQNDDPRLWANFRLFWIQAEMRQEWDGDTHRRYHIITYLPLDEATRQAFDHLRNTPHEGDFWVRGAPWPEAEKARFIPPDFKRPRRRRM